MNFECLFFFQKIQSEISPADEKMESRPVVVAAGQVGKFDLRSPVQPEVVLSPEMDFGPAIADDQFVPFGYGEIDDSFF